MNVHFSSVVYKPCLCSHSRMDVLLRGFRKHQYIVKVDDHILVQDVPKYEMS